MKVQFAPQLMASNSIKSNYQNKEKQNITSNYNYNPLYYKDFNISFGQRLFRSPENFYEQDFNEQTMPKSLHKYIYEGWDTDFKRTIPPAQAMKEVFGSLEYAQNLDQVKLLYPDEPLFKNLTSTPKKKSREGLLGFINMAKEAEEYQDKTLFKNGKNDLGMYILKKIYIEGKTLEEINHDFKRDVSKAFEGFEIKPQDYSAFGIKFPERSFWHSFLPTRTDRNFKYVRIPKTFEERQQAQRNAQRTNEHKAVSRPKPNKFENVKAWEVDKITKTIEDGSMNVEETQKRLRKNKNSEATNFVAQYMSEIMYVTLEKLHVSPEMKSFFENYENLSDSQKAKFKKYWETPDVKELRSYVMKPTIQMFMEAYGVDGNNEEFQELLEYAHSIKPNRIKAQEEHDKRQAEYEELFAIKEDDDNNNPFVKELQQARQDIDEFLNDLQKTLDISRYDVETEDGKVIIVGKPKEALEEYLRKDLELFPKKYADKEIKFIMDDPRTTNEFAMAFLFGNKDLEIPENDERFMSRDEAMKISNDIATQFSDKYQIEMRAAQQAVFNAYINVAMSEGIELSPEIFNIDIHSLKNLNKHMQSSDSYDKMKEASKNSINSDYEKYLQPLSSSEVNKATITAMDLLRKYDPKNSITLKNENINQVRFLFAGLGVIIKNKTKNKDLFRESLNTYIANYGGSARFLLDKNMPEHLKIGKLEDILLDALDKYPGEILSYVALDYDGAQYIKENDPALFQTLYKNIISQVPVFRDKFI